MDTAYAVRKTMSPIVCDLPADVLILILSRLHGQDIARCYMVCRRFMELIRSDLRLQYQIELTQNGMVDCECSTLPVSERLYRLRQYSSNFKSGAFQREDLTAHPDYVIRNRQLGWPRTVLSAKRPSGSLYKKSYQDDSPLYLSLFVPGSLQGGIPSSRALFTIREMEKRGLTTLADWAMDETQDLFVVAEMTRLSLEERMDQKVPELYMRFYSLSGLKTGTITPHPVATLPFIRLHVVDSGNPRSAFKLQIVGDYAVLELQVEIGDDLTSFFVNVYCWKTGQMISTTNVGTAMVDIIPLDEPYMLFFPSIYEGTTSWDPQRHLTLSIYSFSPSPSPSPSPACEAAASRLVCTLELPTLRSGEHVIWSGAHTGDRADETTGHFRADPSQSIIVLRICIRPIDGEYEAMCMTYLLLIPRATLTAHIPAVDSTQRHGGSTVNPPVSVPWADWRPRGCLRLCPQNPLFQDDARLTSFGSRLPIVMFDGPEKQSTSVYVFDVNPLVARSVLAAKRATEGGLGEQEQDMASIQLKNDAELQPVDVTQTAVVEDIEKVLLDVVDPDCAVVPYVVYRFPLPYSPRGEQATAPEIREVTMSMAGFTVEFDASVEYEKRTQTWTV